MRCFNYVGGRGGSWPVQVMVALSQVRVSVPMAVRARACRGVRRVVRSMFLPLAVSFTRRMRLSSLRARAALSLDPPVGWVLGGLCVPLKGLLTWKNAVCCNRVFVRVGRHLLWVV